MIPLGEQGELFLPEPQTGFTNGLAPDEWKPKPISYWQEAVKAINEALAEAQNNPETARSLFALASRGQRDPESLDRLRAVFVKDGIPPEFLSHYEPE